MKTTDKNILIAEFMKWDILNDMTYSEATKGKWIELNKLKFHSNWNWLMEVVGRIESLGGAVCIGNGNCVMIVFYIGAVTDESYSKTRELTGETKIEAVYNAVVSFIEWYNSAEKK